MQATLAKIDNLNIDAATSKPCIDLILELMSKVTECGVA